MSGSGLGLGVGMGDGLGKEEGEGVGEGDGDGDGDGKGVGVDVAVLADPLEPLVKPINGVGIGINDGVAEGAKGVGESVKGVGDGVGEDGNGVGAPPTSFPDTIGWFNTASITPGSNVNRGSFWPEIPKSPKTPPNNPGPWTTCWFFVYSLFTSSACSKNNFNTPAPRGTKSFDNRDQ